jgi:FkbM family methyltransferase
VQIPKRLSLQLVYSLRSRIRELLSLIFTVRLLSLWNVLLCYVNFQKRAVGFTEIGVRGLPAPVRLRNATSDFMVFRQVFLEKQYAIPGVAEAHYVIDAGANIGLTSLYILARNPKVRIIAVEPDSENYVIAVHNVKPFADRCHLLHAAIWSSEVTLGVSRGTYRDGEHWSTQTITAVQNCPETVSGYTIETLLRKFDFPHIDLLKIDIEGAELNLFRDGDTGFLDKTVCCVIECHGDDCEQAFASAAERHGFQSRICGELIIATPSQTTPSPE